MPRPVGEPGATGASVEAHRKHKPAPRNPSANTPRSAKTPAGAARYAEQHVVEEVTPSGEHISGAGSPLGKGAHIWSQPKWPDIVSHLESKRQDNALEFHKQALESVATRHLKFNKDGEVETKTVKVPQFKTSPQAVKKASHELKKMLAEAKKAGADPEKIELAKAIGARRIAKHNYQLDKNGNIVFKKVVVPKLKTSPKSLKQDLQRVNKITSEIRYGHKVWKTPKEHEEDTPILGKLFGGVVGAISNAGDITLPSGPNGATTKVNLTSGFPVLTNASKDIIKAYMAGQHSQQMQSDAQMQAAGFGFVPDIRNRILHGVRTGIGYGTEYLTRPGMAIEAGIAEGLSDPNSPLGKYLLSEKARKKLAKGASPLDVILHGHGAKHAITGGELGEALFGARQVGLPIDIITDPTMYIGLAGLPAKFAERSAAITSRLADQAPEALKEVEFTRLIGAAHKSGDYEQVTKYLEDLAKEHGVSLRKLGKTKADRAAIAEVNNVVKERAREIADLIEKGRAESPIIHGKSIHVPGEASQQAAEEIAKFGLRRQLKPGFTLEIRTPLGRKLGGIEVPIPKSLAEARVVPRLGALPAALGRPPESGKILEMARNSKAEAAVYREHALEHEELLNKVSDLEAKPTASRTELRAAEHELAEFEDGLRAKMMDARATEAGGTGMASMSEIIRSTNARRFAHEIYRSTNALGRQTQRQFFHNVMVAVNPIKGDRASRIRVGAHMSLNADVGNTKLLDKVAPLTTKERKVVDDLNSIYKELERYGFETGTLKRAVENYLPRYWTTADDIAGPLHAGPKSEDILPLGGKRGANSAFQQHRTMAEMAAIADKQKLAKMIRTIATKPVSTSESLKLAEDWFRNSKIRFAMEDMAQAVQRGQILKEDQLTELQKAAYDWSRNMVTQNKEVPALFQDLGKTEGVLKINPSGARYHALPDEPFTGLSTHKEWQVKMSSALESRTRIKNLMTHADAGSALHGHYSELLKQRESEIDQLLKDRPREAADRPITPVNDGSEAPTAEMVGLATDREIENFLPIPNASEDFVGTLKDFRRDHPDKFPVLDPLLANYHRTRAEGLQTVYRTRWRAIDKSVGRSTEEARASRYVLADGRSGYTSEIKPVFPDQPLDPHAPNDKPIYYEVRDSGEKIYPEDIEFPGRTLIPNREYNIWYDPSSGREYSEAPQLDPAVGTAIKDAIGPDRLWPTDVIRDTRAEFFRMGETGMTDLYDSGLETLVQRALTMVRYGVTTLFPAFHVRNMISDTFLSMLADPGMLFHPVANAKLTWSVMNRGGKVKLGHGVEMGVDYVNVPHLGKLKPEDYLAVMDSFGLRSNQHIAEMARLAERGDVPQLEKWYQGIHSYRRPAQIVKGGFGLGPSGAVGRRTVEFSARREDIARIVTFTQRMRRNGGDFADAMWWTIKHHFDYGDLNPFERRWMRNLFLFYTWYRKNIPLQFMSLITRPGFFSGMTNAYIDLAEGETPLNFNWSKINPILPDMSGPVPNSGLVPDYMFDQLGAVSTNWNGHALAVGFGAPWADMNLITHFFENPEENLRQWLSLFNPAISLPFQYAFRKDLLTGREFDKRESSGAAQILGWIGDKFGVNLTSHDEEGNPVLPWQLNLAFNQFPVGGRLSGYFRQTPITEDPGRVNKWFGGGFGSFMTGFNAYVSPGSGERLDAAYISRVIGRAAQRKALSEQGGTPADLNAFDKQTIEWAKQLGIPHKYLEVVPGIGPAYVTQEERESFHLSGGSPLSGGSAGALKGLTSEGGYGLGGLETKTKPKEYKSQTEESVEKLLHPGAFEPERSLHVLGESVIPISGPSVPSNPLVEGTGTASKAKLDEALGRLRANKAAREGETVAAPPEKSKKTLGPPVKGGVQNPAILDKRIQKKAQQPINEAVAKAVEPKDLPTKKLPQPKIPNIEGFDNKDQQEFARWFAHYSKIPPKLAGEWVKQEGGGWGSHGVSGGEAGEQNWLGVGYPGHTTSMSESHYFNGVTPKQAAKNTALWLEGKIGHEYGYKAADSIIGIHRLVKQGATEQQIRQYIEGPSGWGTGTINQSGIIVNGKTHGESGFKIVHSRQAAKTVIKLADKFAGTQEGSALQAHWAELSGISSSEAWCSAFLAALMRRVGLPQPDSPASAGTWATWKGGKPIGTTDLSKAHPGDILEFGSGSETSSYADHVGLYIGNGEMISGNFGNEVRRGPVSEESTSIQAIVRPNYTGKKVTFKLEVSPAVVTGPVGGSSGTASGSSEGPSPGYHPGRSEQLEKSIKNMRYRVANAGGFGSSSSTSLPSLPSGGGTFLTVNQAAKLGSSGTELLPEGSATKALERMEERGTAPGSTIKLPKLKRKSSKL